MSPVHEEPSAKRRRLAGRENAAQQHSSSHSDSNDSVLECPQRQAPFSSHASPSTPSPNTISSSQFQQGTREPSQMHLVGTEPTPHGPFSIIQPWERASNTWYHSAWGQMPYFASTHVPNHGHVWHNPAAILPIPPHFHSQGVSPLLTQNYCSLPTETTTILHTTPTVVHQESPSSGRVSGIELSTGIAEVGPETADSSGEEIVCFGMVGFNYDVYQLETF
jgi:hypothetical protein